MHAMLWAMFKWPRFFGIAEDLASVKEKPHIKRLNGLWYCAGNERMDFGFTPSHAYENWLKGNK